MPRPAAVSALLMAFILVTITAESVSWSRRSIHYRNRGERNFASQCFIHRLMKRQWRSSGNGNEDDQDKGKEWWMPPQNFKHRILGNNDKITFVENVTDYPKEMLKKILKTEGREHEDIFGKDPLYMDRTVLVRIGPQETKLCPSLEKVVYPKVGVNKKDEWKYIVNLDEEYVQGVRVETCGHLNKCSMSESFPAGYTAMCVQKYMFRRLLAVSDNGKTKVDEFKLPSCCSCVVKGPS